MRNSTLTSPPFAEWLASRGSGCDASPNWGGDEFRYRPAVGGPLDHERLAVLGNEILEAAIKLAALLEAAQRSERRLGGDLQPEPAGV